MKKEAGALALASFIVLGPAASLPHALPRLARSLAPFVFLTVLLLPYH